MTKTFTEKGIEYLLVEVRPDYKNDFQIIRECGSVGTWQLEYPFHEEFRPIDYVVHDLPCEHVIISLLKDITEEQAHSIISNLWFEDDCHEFLYRKALNDYLAKLSIDTSLNWLLLKKI